MKTTLEQITKSSAHTLGFFSVLQRREPDSRFAAGTLSVVRRAVRDILRMERDLRPLAREWIRAGIENGRNCP